ncbi:MAG: lysine--tRNA ligase [Planctomycetes bacterium]|nr:lysine--tRNA ligase [Planctomycetota bacterium]
MSEQREVRAQKVEALRVSGTMPWPDRFRRSHSTAEARGLPAGTTGVTVAGRLRLIRVMGKLLFAHLQDAAGQLQILVRREAVGEGSFEMLKKLVDLGDFLGATGSMMVTKTGEITLEARGVTFLGKALRPLPEKWHGLTDLELCYRQRYLDLVMSPETRERFGLRVEVIRQIRRMLEERGFTEVETPVLMTTPSGALARPFVTHHHALDIPLYLRIAPETYLKRLIVGGYERVYEFARCFRNEGMDPSHLQDFTMLEYYVAYWSYEENMEFTEELLKTVLTGVYGSLETARQRTGVDWSGEWPRVPLSDLIEREAGIRLADFPDAPALRDEVARRGLGIEDAAKLGRGSLVDQIYKKLCRPKLVSPVFLVRHPIDLSPLARRSDDDPSVADRFQLVVKGWEVVNAYSELVDPVDQRKRLEDQARLRQGGDAEAMEMDEDYLLAMEHGMPPISGWGMGIDRFVALLSNAANLRDVVFFPTMR